VLYDYERLSEESENNFYNFYISSNNTLFEIAAGYDFGRLVPRLFFDMGAPSSGTVNFIEGAEKLTETMNTKNIKFGLEIGIKLIETANFDLTIPMGLLFCSTTFTQKEPSYVVYVYKNYPYDRIWDYSYTNLFSGINAAFQLNSHFKIGVFMRTGFPVKKDGKYKEVLKGDDYVWTSTGSKTYSYETNMKGVQAFSLGIGILMNM
jgi:hypothetical protein